MDDWSVDFSLDMINGTRRIVINCKNMDDAIDCAHALHELGVRYRSGNSPKEDLESKYKEYRSDFCFYVQDRIVYYGPKRSTMDNPWSQYEKCTFNGLNIPDISDDSFSNIIGGGR